MMKLGCVNLSIGDSRVNSGHSAENIVDLNLNEKPDVVSSEEGGDEGCEVNKIEGKLNASMCEGKVLSGDDCKGMEVENEERVKGAVSNNTGFLKVYCADSGHCSRILGQDPDVGGEGKDTGTENGSMDLANGGPWFISESMEEGLDIDKILENGKKKMVCQDKKGMEGDTAMGENAVCPQGVAIGGIDDKQVDSLDICLITTEDGRHNSEGEKGPENCDSGLDRSLKFNSDVVKECCEKRCVIESSEGKFDEGDQSNRLKREANEGGIQVVGKVLRSRVVPANGLGEEAGGGQIRASPNKRKRETDGRGEAAATMKDVGNKVAGDSKRLCSSGRPKMSIDQSKGEVVELNNVQLVSKIEDGDANDASLRSSEKKRKRGRPKMSTDHLEDQAVHVYQLQAVSKIEDEDKDDKSTLNMKKERCGEQKSVKCSEEDNEVVCKDEAEIDVSKKSVASLSQRRKSERSKRVVDYCERVVVQRKKLSHCKLDDEPGDEDEGLSNVKVASSKGSGKRGTPRKQVRSGSVKMVSYDNDISDDGKPTPSLSNAPIRRPRPDIDHHGAPSKATDEVPSVKGTSSDKQRVETVGSPAAEKNSIRNQIVDMLLHAGWTVEYRPRNGKEYKDAVYVNRKGQTHWSVTKAYYSLQQEFEKGKTDSSAVNFSFTPLPEEVLSKLFRIVSKTRSDKNKKKKHKGDDDTSDEEVIGDKCGSKLGAKSKHSALKRKPSVRDGTQSKRRCVLVARRSKGLNSESVEAISHSGKHSILAWLIDSGAVSLDGKVQYMNHRKTRTMLEGSITRDGIYCHCCKEVFSVFEFEKHTGSESKIGQPYENLYLESGQSLIQCQLDSWNKQDAASLKGFHSVNVDADDPSDDTCAICGDGGDLMCCDGCPSTFHHDCLNIEEVPSGEWHCVYCSCKVCGGAEAQMIDDHDTTSSSLVTCCLCEEKYHQSCVDEEDPVHVKSRRASFCGNSCEQIFEQLQTLIGAKSDLGDGFSWTLLQRFDVKAEADSLEAQKIQNNSKLAVALSVMDECFVPIIDPRSGIDLIRNVVYNSGSNFMRINFSGFFTIVLEKGDEVISAASIRIHGKKLAEMPFIGTRNIYRRQGMCRRLLTAIELALGSLDVETLVIPAIPELMDTWTSVFGFQPLEESIREETRSTNMLVFAHTDLLQKPLSKHNLVEKGIVTIENGGNCSKSSNELLDGGAEKSEVDDGCFNGSFDLNVAAPSIHDFSPDERPAGCNSEHCGDEVKSGTKSEGADDADKPADLPIPMEINDERVENSALVMNSYHPEPSCDEKATVCADEAAKSTLNSIDPSKCDDLSNTSDDRELGATDFGTNDGNAYGEVKLGSKYEVHEPSLAIAQSTTDVSSNGSLLTSSELIEHSKSGSHVVCRSVTQVSSEPLCNSVSAAGESTTTGLFLGNSAPKVG